MPSSTLAVTVQRRYDAPLRLSLPGWPASDGERRVPGVGVAAYALLTFPLAYLWHLVVFANLYDGLGIFNREEPIVVLGLLAILFQGLLLSFVYPYFDRGGAPAKQGLRFGALAGLFLWSSQVVAAAAKHDVTSLGLWLGIESAYFALQFPLVGLAIALIDARARSRVAAHA